MGDGADELTATLRARDLAGEGVLGGIGGTLADVFAAFGQDVVGLVELAALDDRVVRVDDGDVAEVLLSDVLPVGDDGLDRPL
jgi:hypothetical protein